jgi:hypothetical protein
MTAEDCALDGGFCIDAVRYIGIERLFGKLWDGTVSPELKERYSWAANPWVYVYEFERTECPDAYWAKRWK